MRGSNAATDQDPLFELGFQLEPLLYTHIGHGTAACCNAHDSSNWDSRITTQSGYKYHPLSKWRVCKKIGLSLYFRKNITCLSVALLRVGQVFSLFRKTVCRWVKIDCCFMSDICNRAYSQFWFAPDPLKHNCPVNRGVCIQARKNKQLSIQRTIQHSTTRWQHEGRLNYTWFVLRIKLPPLNDAVEQSVDIMADLLMTARRWWWWW